MGEKVVYKEFCTGCGLCHSAYGIELQKDGNGYLYPVSYEGKQKELSEICPAGGHASQEMDAAEMWGKTEKVFLGWSADQKIRKQASSGGVLTALCCYLLEQNLVDGIIQTAADAGYHTKTVISRTPEEVKKCMGSRYSISSPLLEIKQILKEEERYAFVGKPCDVSALRMYLKEDEKLESQIGYLFSFFCAGMPGERAQKQLLHELGCDREEECDVLQYRGNGWPGYATVTKKDGTQAQMSYDDSWGKILGRDVRKICRYCIDGIGEMADVSCGDAWYLTADGRPDFSEKEGRNVIFARNPEGLELILAAASAGTLSIEEYERCKEELKKIQKYQYERRSTMHAMLSGLRTVGKCTPAYNSRLLKAYEKNADGKLKLKRFLGTVKRAVKGKL